MKVCPTQSVLTPTVFQNFGVKKKPKPQKDQLAPLSSPCKHVPQLAPQPPPPPPLLLLSKETELSFFRLQYIEMRSKGGVNGHNLARSVHATASSDSRLA
ncbi:hypothetical protein PoB_006574400 [Plakobranchus ocellatus]|uniref:Uncharacterized protein n=1 Tax=Plakobranchus ocellatus TaxID=259542 RepID=A0AAV4D533_9GAST|nr:hypothetical protein PoB_006574400 [Plakobranchus ocellatus]